MKSIPGKYYKVGKTIGHMIVLYSWDILFWAPNDDIMVSYAALNARKILGSGSNKYPEHIWW